MRIDHLGTVISILSRFIVYRMDKSFSIPTDLSFFDPSMLREYENSIIDGLIE